jgi:dihydrofolate reductase
VEDPDSNVTIAENFEQVLERAKTENIWVIGGRDIYRMALRDAAELYLTRVHAEIEGDTFFPEWDESEWNLRSIEYHPADEKHEHSFTWEVWRRRKDG